ncbi:MAG: RHS repeat-associated core domain-containing protein [Gammaproteobacteria bacterium]|nr:RHS repeat-associated core domain-containing protein [Gammaproteobacteria bacterium]MBQ0841239.1 RHS repeat-associated core domain-containing protein [Gammaproteobacteria bacterium]
MPEALINATHSQSYNAQKNRLLSATSTDTKNYSYDNEGQTQTVTGQNTSNSYIFDGAHRLTGYNSNGQSNSYQYDGIGNRLSATRNGTTTQYIYDAVGNLLAEANSSGTITRYYIHGLGLMAFVDAQTSQLYVYHHDATGHTVAITDNNQTVVNKYAYDPYGKLLAKQEQITQPFTYVGQYGVMTEAEDSDLYYMRARYYDAQIGRFISEDPIGMAGGINLYAYVGGNPMMWVDPSGFGKIGLLIRTVKGGWQNVTSSQARRRLAQGGDVKVIGNGASKKAKQLAKEKFGQKTVRHDAHTSGQIPHYQHKNGGRGHVFYGKSRIVIPGAAIGASLFGEDSWAAEIVNFFNPLSDLQDVSDLVSGSQSSTSGK